MKTIILLLIFLTLVACEFNTSDFLQNWIKYSRSYLGYSTLLDITIPGSHDTLTYDLDNVVA